MIADIQFILSNTFQVKRSINAVSRSLVSEEKINDENGALNKKNDDLDVAADMVFRPLFRYRQETNLKPRPYNPCRYCNNYYRNRQQNPDYDY